MKRKDFIRNTFFGFLAFLSVRLFASEDENKTALQLKKDCEDCHECTARFCRYNKNENV